MVIATVSNMMILLRMSSTAECLYNSNGSTALALDRPCPQQRPHALAHLPPYPEIPHFFHCQAGLVRNSLKQWLHFHSHSGTRRPIPYSKLEIITMPRARLASG